MPHEKDIKRKYEVPMSIELKDEFVGKPPPHHVSIALLIIYS